MNFDDYESLPTTSVSTNMIAGAVAGVMEHCIMYPLDSVKTRMQSLKGTGRTITATFTNMVQTEGMFRPIRGMGAVVAGAGPAHAFYFGSYEYTKEFLSQFTTHNQLNYIASAVTATLIHDAISNPTEVVKQRMQMYNSKYRTVVQCIKGVYTTEGLRAFYRSYSTQLFMNIPFQSIHFTTYEFFQNMLNQDRKYNPPVHVIAGGAAGACASALTTPLDVVKTLLNTQETGFTKGMKEAIRQIYTMAGPRGFFKGLYARVLYSMPATAICWSTYEFFKFYLAGRSNEEYKSSIVGKKLHTKDVDAVSTLSSDKLLYVLPATKVSAADASIVEDELIKLKSTTTSPTTTSTTQLKESSSNNSYNSNNSNSNSNNNSGSSIKSVCELSSNVTGDGIYPRLNLNTRHTDVKAPYERTSYTG